MLELSVVIPTYNRKEVLKKTLETLFSQTYPKGSYEIIVVDDGSTDSTEEMLKSLKSPCTLKYLRQAPSKKGPAAANNLGIKNASGDFILFINDDIIASPELVEEHMKFHKKYKNIIVQGKVINVPSLEDLTLRHKGYACGYSDISFGYFTTWNASAPKKILIEAGLFDEDFVKLSWEDVEFGFRLRKRGIKQKSNPLALGYHYKKPFTLADLESIKGKSIEMGHNGVLYYRKHPCLEVKVSVQAFWLPFLIHSLLRWIINSIDREKILNYLKSLEERGRFRLLGFLVGLAGYYWYLTGVKKAWTSQSSSSAGM